MYQAAQRSKTAMTLPTRNSRRTLTPVRRKWRGLSLFTSMLFSIVHLLDEGFGFLFFGE